jgi:hypothetical protein
VQTVFHCNIRDGFVILYGIKISVNYVNNKTSLEGCLLCISELRIKKSDGHSRVKYQEPITFGGKR